MPMNPRILRPLIGTVGVIFNFLMTTISGQSVVTQSGEELRTIQDA